MARKKIRVHEGGLKGGKFFGRQPWMYTMLGMPRDEFVKSLCGWLLDGITHDYAQSIAERIAEDVAKDICDCADVEKWNDCDMRLAIGRVLLKAVGGDC